MLRFNVIHSYNPVANVDGSHAVARGTITPFVIPAGVSAQITFGDAGTANETIVFNSLTYTAKDSGATGREFNIGGSAALSAAAFAAALTAHADGGTYTAVADSAVVTLTHKTPTGTLTNVTGTFNISTVFIAPVVPAVDAVPAVGSGVTLVFDDAVASTKDKLWQSVRAALRALRRDSTRNTSPTTFSTSVTTTE